MNAIPDPAADDARSAELTRLRAEPDRLLRIVEAQSATATLLAAKLSQNAVGRLLISLSLLLVLVRMRGAWFHFYQPEPVSEGTGSGTCADWSPWVRRAGLAGMAPSGGAKAGPFSGVIERGCTVCGRFVLSRDRSRRRDAFGIEFPVDRAPSYNVAPS